QYAHPRTLILLHKQRLDAAYGVADTTALLASLQQLADHPDVQGLVVPVENSPVVSATYHTWDNGNACDPQVANQVAQAIKEQVVAPYLDAYPSIRYLVLVGDDRMIPFYRVPDDAYLANEAAYTLRAGLLPANSTFAALHLGFILTDDFYADHSPLLWRGRELFLPDLSLGRLVESPSQVRTLIHTFLDRGGLHSPASALVTGYDFLIDSAEAISDTLAHGGLTPDTLIHDGWDAAQLQSNWLDTRQDVASVNAHFDHWQAIPATGAATVDANDVVTSTTSMSGTVNFSMGCHSGYNVPDDHATTDFGLDFAQAMARKGAWWIANTGYGYGMDDSVAFTERVMHLFTQKLTSDQYVPVGEALTWAKNEYLGSAPSGGYGTYHEKVSIEATLYGLPMYRVSVPTPGGRMPSQAPATVELLSPVQGTALSTVTISLTPDLQPTTTPDGDYYAVNGETQASPGRPVQPVTRTVLPEFAGMTPHDALFLSGRISSRADFDPLISRPVTDTALAEPAYEYAGWYPIKPFTVNRLGDPPRLVVVPAWYYGDEANGIEKLFHEMTFEIYYAAEGESDFAPPSVWEVKGVVLKNTAIFRVLAQDDSGVERVIVTYSEDGEQWQSSDLNYDSDSGYWKGLLTGLSGQVSYFVQAVDQAGNVGVSVNKGLFFEPEEHTIYLPLVLRSF
ncbi:MAG: hypothetical protein DRI48_11025, partial [Chloroflexi bacterium]